MAVQRYNTEYTPPATMILAGVLVAISIADAFTGALLERVGWARGIDIQYGQYWRLLTSAFVHASVMHILFNAYGLWVLGVIFERLHGWRPLVLVFAASAVGGSALAMTFYDPNIPLVGASGGVYGLFGAVLGVMYVRTGSVRGIMQVPMGRQLLVWLGFGVVMSLMPGISMLGHLGGFVPGAVLGVFYEHRHKRELDIYHKLSVAVLALGIIGAAVFACVPFTRASWHACNAIRAYERGDDAAGDAHFATARGKRARDAGSRDLLEHLELWTLSPERDLNELRAPLTHPEGLVIDGRRVPEMPFSFLTRKGDVLESAD